ncbi:hypothetical protein C5167_031005 [Papaver somniferum]|uniref:MLP-like protein 328 n=1 Tax=Papaver somniferum TaxID=3469 RepID=UPI000E6F8DFD|nr:MLP-like protein 328 [Papaver somniferum]RZC90293.1 hypothetical protein C5167_031005 [Papaver somniferum]
MAANRKFEVEFKVKCSAEKFYSMMTRDVLKLPRYAPQNIHNVQVVSGEGELRLGSVSVWDYVLDNKPFGVRTRAKITAMDHQNMSLTFTVVDGYLSDDYTSFSNTLTITTPTQRDGNYNCLVKWSVQFQKANDNVPDPTYYMKMQEDLTKELDANLLKEG